jgi:hypothetical protein
LCWRASPESEANRAQARCPADAGEVRTPVRQGQKNDFRDTEAIAEAVQRPTMKFVATKTADQLDLQALHRVRERLDFGDLGKRVTLVGRLDILDAASRPAFQRVAGANRGVTRARMAPPETL